MEEIAKEILRLEEQRKERSAMCDGMIETTDYVAYCRNSAPSLAVAYLALLDASRELLKHCPLTMGSRDARDRMHELAGPLHEGRNA